MAMCYLKAYYSWRRLLQPLSDEERGRLITAALQYAEEGTYDEPTGAERYVLPAILDQIDRDRTSYNSLSQIRSAAGSKGGRPPKANKSKKNNSFSEKANESKKSQDKEKDKEKDKDIRRRRRNIRARGRRTDIVVIGLYRKMCPDSPQGITAKEAQRIRTFVSFAIRHGKTVDDYRALFREVQSSRFLRGLGSHDGEKNPFCAALVWLVDPAHMDNVLAGQYRDWDAPRGETPAASFETDEFFEAALQRSYGMSRAETDRGADSSFLGS